MGGGSLQSSGPSEVTSVIISKKKVSNRSSVTCGPKSLVQGSLSHLVSSGPAGQIALFLLKVAALETVRRVSQAKCPFVWRGVQALQFLCYPPFKWIERWAPFKGLVKGMQMLSRPLLVLSIATTFSDLSEPEDETSDGSGTRESHACSEPLPEQPPVNSAPDTRVCDEGPQHLASEEWVVTLHNALEEQGIKIPERLNQDELRRFYMVAKGDFPCFLASIKKTIRWRETYSILSEQELEMWSNMVFWHGADVKGQPCLIVRLGFACTVLPPHDRPRFAQAIVSQIEHGVLHLVDGEHSHVTVLVDCEGLTFKVPMQVLRSCSTILQDHFPNRLACLFVIRLPPVVRVIAQTFIQVLRPVTRQKLKIIGDAFEKVLSEHLETIPSYLGGKCLCTRCSALRVCNVRKHSTNIGLQNIEQNEEYSSEEDLPSHSYQNDISMNSSCDHALRTTIIAILILWLFIALLAGLYDPESLSLVPP